MTLNKKIAALIVAGGSGTRFGAPKQYLPLLGKNVLQWSIDAFDGIADEIVVVTNPDHPQPKSVHCIAGGETRQQSVRNGLLALRAAKPDIVLIHDAARPLIARNLINALIAEAEKSGAAIPALPVTDTIKRNGKTESRENLFTVQTPQAFDFALVDKLHEKYRDKGKPYTDDAALCEAEGQDVTLVAGQPDNIKITYPEDLARAESLLSACNGDVRTGQGYDVHRLVPANGKKLMLCGVAIPHDFALEGHSDADAGLHAVTDALLAAIGAGDIGHHFSPSDARWKNADSAVFLKHAADLVTKHGGLIAHIDVTIVCEAPKIAPHRASMQQRIADILHLPAARVSVKATTTEGLGFTGRREGIAATALATVRLPFSSAILQMHEELKWAS